ncbi:hypothetical protein [Lentzea flaviverrucosa]|uniref:DUF3558 domain-containing protein n=1 Tax=Lentzea flaviverrucosa TaxID=200379 RepID=A0A1H9PQH0_9PSEU|nr:hypothetical protein [Lentzea flaviverrucosa]RDI29770.1 hypothetical protein DFR72_105189 [Lentzea flaviverrucosa]SER50330.1 hypothetical protein SAMN05216195_105383 [Lentzea flaviverrucosa]
MIITAVLAAVVLVGGAVTAAVFIKNDDAPAVAGDPGPADGDILEQRTSPEGVRYGDLAVIDACTLMPVTLLEETGFGDVAHGLHSQTFVPKSVRATAEDASDGISSCRYDVVKPGRTEFLNVTVQQAPFNDPLPAQVIGNAVAKTIGGLRAFVDPKKDPGDYFTRVYSVDGRTAVLVHASNLGDNKGFDHETAHAALVEKIALNLAAAPKEQTRFAYTGRYEDVPAACDVLTDAFFEQVSQAKDSGVVQAEFWANEMRKEFPQSKTETQYAFVTSQMCQRSSPEWLMRERGVSLKMELSIHRDAAMVAINEPDCAQDSAARQALGKATPSQEKVGDADACVFPIGDSLVYSFTAGRTQVRLTPYGPWASKAPEEFIGKFTPVAQKAADEVRKAIG